TKPVREPLPHQATEKVGPAAGGKANDDAHRPRRIIFRPSNPRDDRKRRSTRCQMQKCSAGKVHGGIPKYWLGPLLIATLNPPRYKQYAQFSFSPIIETLWPKLLIGRAGSADACGCGTCTYFLLSCNQAAWRRRQRVSG